jgi:hypothetical protein
VTDSVHLVYAKSEVTIHISDGSSIGFLDETGHLSIPTAFEIDESLIRPFPVAVFVPL